MVTDDSEKRHALECLAKKYSLDYLEAAGSEIDGEWKRVCVIELAIEHMTGKAAIEIVKERAHRRHAGDVARRRVVMCLTSGASPARAAAAVHSNAQARQVHAHVSLVAKDASTCSYYGASRARKSPAESLLAKLPSISSPLVKRTTIS